MTRFSWIVLALFVAAVVFQVFAPPEVGIANNGDYSKMIARFSLGYLDLNNPDELLFYERDWRFDRRYEWVSDNYSSELILIGAAISIGRLFNTQVFDIRILGAIHAILWAACFAALLPLFSRLSGWRRYALPILALAVFTDASYIVHCNSMHTDTAAFLFLSWTLAIALRIAAGDWRGPFPIGAMLLTAILFTTAKPQHSLLGLLFWILVAAVVWNVSAGWMRAGWLAASCLIPFATYLTITHVPVRERQLQMFNSIFSKLLPGSSSPESDLLELGFTPGMKSWIGSYADQTVNNPLNNFYVTSVLTPAAHRRLALFYLTHPARAFAIIYSDLPVRAADRRPPFLGNYRRVTGLPPRTLARSFHWWSDIRSRPFRIAPWHIAVWYAVFLAGLWRLRNLSGVIALVVAAAGLLALASASLGDSGETDRHLWIFHVLTDFTILLALTQTSPFASRERAS